MATPPQARPNLSNPYLRPMNPLEQLLADLWEKALGVKPVGAEDNFFALGGNSSTALKMVLEVETQLGKSVAADEFLRGATVRQLAAALLGEVVSSDQPAEVQPGPPERRLFFLHGDWNGRGLYCIPLARHLGDYGFYALPPLGLTEDVVPQSIEDMATVHVRTLTAFQPQGPYVLGGHCNGSLVAIEMAQQLRRQGHEVAHVIMLDPPKTLNRRDDAPKIALKIELRKPSDSPWPAYDLSHLPAASRALPLANVYKIACLVYRIRPYPGRLTLLRPSENPQFDSVARRFQYYFGATAKYLRPEEFEPIAWEAISDQIVDETVPGNHFTMVTKHVHVVAERMLAHLQV